MQGVQIVEWDISAVCFGCCWWRIDCATEMVAVPLQCCLDVLPGKLHEHARMNDLTTPDSGPANRSCQCLALPPHATINIILRSLNHETCMIAWWVSCIHELL